MITDVTEMKPCPNPCSWTSAYVPYYLHTINRAKLENYFLQLRNPSLRAKSSDTGSRRSSTPNSKASNSRESSVGRNMRDKSSENCRINGSGEDAWSVRYVHLNNKNKLYWVIGIVFKTNNNNPNQKRVEKF